MDRQYFWSIVFGLGVVTFFVRLSFFYLYDYIKISKSFEKSLSLIPAAVLPTIVAPALFFHEGSVAAVMGKERLIVGLLAMVVCYKTKNIFITLLFGMFTLFVFRWILA